VTTQYKETILGTIKSLAPLPVSTQKIALMIAAPKTEVSDLASVIEKDAILTARLLSVSNSSFYGFPGTITTISRAVTIIGFNGVKSLALGLAIIGDIKKNRNNPRIAQALENLWRHALAVATAARHIAGHIGYPIPEEAFVAGLLHDIGKVILIENFFEDYNKIIAKSTTKPTALDELEKATFGLSHSEIGTALCQHWNIPPNLSQAVAEHHVLPGQATDRTKSSDLVFSVKVGESLTKIAQVGCNGNSNLLEESFKRIQDTRIPFTFLQETLLFLPEEVANAEQFFNISHIAKHEGNKPKDAKNLAYVLFEEETHGTLVALLLTSLGYRLLKKETLEENLAQVAGVICDKALDLPLQNKLKKLNIPCIDFSACRPEEAWSNGLINIPSLSEWLSRKLNPKIEENQ